MTSGHSESGIPRAESLEDPNETQNDTSWLVARADVTGASPKEQRRQKSDNALIGDINDTSLTPLVVEKS